MKKVTLLLTGLLFVSCFMNTSKATDVKLRYKGFYDTKPNTWAQANCPKACTDKGYTKFTGQWGGTGRYINCYCD